MGSPLSPWQEKRTMHKPEIQIPAQSDGEVSSATSRRAIAGHMKSTLLHCTIILTAFSATGLVVFHANDPATLSSQSQGESFKAGGLRSFEIVPLETVSETSSNASIGDLNGDGNPDIVLVKGRHWQLPTLIFFGDGKGHFTPGPALPSKASK